MTDKLFCSQLTALVLRDFGVLADELGHLPALRDHEHAHRAVGEVLQS